MPPPRYKVNTCATCQHSRWWLTPRGHAIKKNHAGQCIMPIDLEKLRQEVIAKLPACVTPPNEFHQTAIWPDYTNCPVWEENPGPLKGFSTS